MDNTAKIVSSSFIWRFLERTGAQGVTFIVSIVLARLLDPKVYGIVALITVFTTILQVFVDSGLGNALIQKKNADALDFSSVFYFNIVVCILLYFFIFFAAPIIADFYDNPELTDLIRFLSITLVVSGVKNVQQAYVTRHMLFRKFFFATVGGTIGAAILGVWMAYLGFGVWALVVQSVFNHTVDTLILWLIVKWRPQKKFSFNRLKGLFSYGWKLLVSSLIDTGYREIRQLLIGKIYTSEDLAFYNRGIQFPNLIVTNINSSIDSVLLPTMSKEQDNRDKVRAMTRRAIKTSTFIMMPMMMGLAICAKPLVLLVLTEKWLPCVFFLRVFCVIYAFYPIHTANLNAIKAVGRSDLFLKLEIIKKIVGLTVLIISMFISVRALALSELFISFFSQIVNSWPNRKLLNYKFVDQIKDMFPQIALSVVMGLLVYSLSIIGFNYILTLIVQITCGIIIYIGGAKILHFESYEYVKSLAKSYIKK